MFRVAAMGFGSDGRRRCADGEWTRCIASVSPDQTTSAGKEAPNVAELPVKAYSPAQARISK